MNDQFRTATFPTRRLSLIDRTARSLITDRLASIRRGLVLMTDGVTDALFHTEANLLKKEIWDKFYTHLTNDVNLTHSNPSVSDELLEWLNFWEKGEYDDRTIAILY